MNNFISIDKDDKIVLPFSHSVNATFINSWKDIEGYSKDYSVIFRGMTGRKIVDLCEQSNKSYYYIDTGYIGNMQKRKDWHRIVKNGMQHSNIDYTLPNNRFKKIAIEKPYLKFPGWKKDGKSILVVTPSEKPCKFYGIDRDVFVNNTINEIKKYSDRPVIIRDKVNRRDRVGSGSLYNQLDNDNIFAVVTYNSIAATEAIGYGVPCFTLAPNAADEFCEKDLTLIDTPKYEDKEKIEKWQHWLAYCQYTPKEMLNGTAIKLIRENNLS